MSAPNILCIEWASQEEIAMLKSAPNSSNEGVLKRKALSESTELKVASICLFKYLHLNT